MNDICNDRLQRRIEIDEIRAYRDKNKILVKVHNIEDKIDLLYISSNR